MRVRARVRVRVRVWVGVRVRMRARVLRLQEHGVEQLGAWRTGGRGGALGGGLGGEPLLGGGVAMVSRSY